MKQLDTGDRGGCRGKGLEPQHGPGPGLDTSTVLFPQVFRYFEDRSVVRFQPLSSFAIAHCSMRGSVAIECHAWEDAVLRTKRLAQERLSLQRHRGSSSSGNLRCGRSCRRHDTGRRTVLELSRTFRPLARTCQPGMRSGSSVSRTPDRSAGPIRVGAEPCPGNRCGRPIAHRSHGFCSGSDKLHAYSSVQQQEIALDKLSQLIALLLKLKPENYELRLALAIGLAAEAETTSYWA